MHATAQSGMVFGTSSYGLVGHFICSDWTAYMVTDFRRRFVAVHFERHGQGKSEMGLMEGLYKGEPGQGIWSGRIISQKATATASRR